MSVEGMLLAAKYSFGCNRMSLQLHSVLPKNADTVLTAFIESKEIYPEVVHLLQMLEPYKYYQRIAQLLEINDCFDVRIVKIYWFGRNSAKEIYITRDWHNYIVISKIRKMIQRAAQKGTLPNEKAINHILSCIVCAAKVEEIEGNNLCVIVSDVMFKKGNFLQKKTGTVVKKGFIDDIKPGQLVSTHLGIAREEINQIQAEDLRVNTLSLLELEKVSVL